MPFTLETIGTLQHEASEQFHMQYQSILSFVLLHLTTVNRIHKQNWKTHLNHEKTEDW